MPLNERPGVYSSYEVTSSVRGSAAGGDVACAAVGAKGSELGCVRVTGSAEALEKFGDCALTDLCSVALRCGAGAVVCRAVETGADAEDYAAAFGELCAVEGIGTMFCDSRSADMHEAMMETILAAGESCRYRIGIAESAGTVDELSAAAKALNCERMILAAAESTEAAGSYAAALAGAIAATADPALPINGAELRAIGCSLRYTDADVNTLVRAGVTLIENDAGTPTVLRAVTTRTTTGGAADATWREVTTVRIIDEVIPAIRTALRSRFSRAKNTEQTRGAIRTQVIIELQDRVAREIIDGYGDVTVAPSESDPTVCEVGFGFTVAHGLNHIYLAAKITV